MKHSVPSLHGHGSNKGRARDPESLVALPRAGVARFRAHAAEVLDSEDAKSPAHVIGARAHEFLEATTQFQQVTALKLVRNAVRQAGRTSTPARDALVCACGTLAVRGAFAVDSAALCSLLCSVAADVAREHATHVHAVVDECMAEAAGVLSAGGDRFTLQQLARLMKKPLLNEWADAHKADALPALVRVLCALADAYAADVHALPAGRDASLALRNLSEAMLPLWDVLVTHVLGGHAAAVHDTPQLVAAALTTLEGDGLDVNIYRLAASAVVHAVMGAVEEGASLARACVLLEHVCGVAAAPDAVAAMRAQWGDVGTRMGALGTAQQVVLQQAVLGACPLAVWQGHVCSRADGADLGQLCVSVVLPRLLHTCAATDLVNQRLVCLDTMVAVLELFGERLVDAQRKSASRTAAAAAAATDGADSDSDGMGGGGLFFFGDDSDSDNDELLHEEEEETAAAVAEEEEEPPLDGLRAAVLETLQLVVGALADPLCELVWSTSSDPVRQVGARAQQIMELSMSVLDHMQSVVSTDDARALHTCFFHKFVDSAALLGWNTTGKYNMLLALLPHVGAEALLAREPMLFHAAFGALTHRAVVPAVRKLTTAVLKAYMPVCRAAHGAAWRVVWDGVWVDALVLALAQPHMHSSLFGSVLGELLAIDTHVFATLLAAVGRADFDGRVSPEARLRMAIVLCREARASHQLPGAMLEQIVDGGECDAVRYPAGTSWRLTRDALRDALFATSDELRLQTFELLAVSSVSTEPPTALECSLITEAVGANIKSSSGAFRRELVDHVGTFSRRMTAAMYKQFTRAKAEARRRGESDGEVTIDATASLAFLDHLCTLATDNLFPEATFARKTFALMLLGRLMQVWMGDRHIAARAEQCATLAAPVFFTAARARTLLHQLHEPWDSVRQDAFALLRYCPAPLPGYTEPADVATLLRWARRLMASTRLRESEAGGMLLFLVFDKYVRELGWRVDVGECSCESAQDGDDVIPLFVTSLLDVANRMADEARGAVASDATEERHLLFSGLFLSLRYVLETYPFQSAVAQPLRVQWAALFTRIVDTMTDVLSSALLALAGMLPDSAVAEVEAALDVEVGAAGHGDQVPISRGVVVAAWLTVKEAVLMLATVVARAPLHHEGAAADDVWITPALVRRVGDALLRAMFSTRHQGAVEKSSAAFGLVNERLLGASKFPLFFHIPSEWLGSLHDKLSSDRHGFTRRSGGLPIAFLALLRADPTRPRTLLPGAVDKLLAVAACDAHSELSRVHALNTLRLIVKDRSLSLLRLGTAMETAVAGFASPVWTIRNSSLLLFSALLLRSMQLKRKEGVTAVAYFRRYPDMCPFLLRAIATAVEPYHAGAVNDGTAAHPALYPCLTVLAMLSPSWSMPGEVGAFVPHVVVCGTHESNHYIRVTAARALVPLVPSDGACAFVCTLLDKLPAAPPAPMRWNAVHGVLLQVRGLMLWHLAHSADTVVHALHRDAFPRLAARCWLGSAACRCGMVRALFMELLAGTLASTRALRAAHAGTAGCTAAQMRVWLGDVAALCTDVLGGASSQVPALSLLKAHAATLLLRAEVLFLRAGTNALVGMLVCDGVYEVREAALSSLFKFVVGLDDDADEDDADNADNATGDALVTIDAELMETLCARMETETHYHCRELLFRTLAHAPCAFPAAVPVWARLQAVRAACAARNVQCDLLQCAGAYVARDVSVLGEFAAWLDAASQPDRPADERYAAAAALLASRALLLRDGDGCAPEHMVALFVVVLRLLQDEDEDVCATINAGLAPLWPSGTPVLAAVSVERCFEHCTARYGTHPSWQAALERMALGDTLTDAPSGLAATLSAAALFEREADNAHLEVCVAVQLACAQLEVVLRGRGDDAHALLCRVHAALCTAVERVRVLRAQPHWLGDVTSDRTLFVHLYRLVLAHATLVRVCGDERAGALAHVAGADVLHVQAELREVLVDKHTRAFLRCSR